MSICGQCGAKAHARGMCYAHYMRWYKLHRDEARRLLLPQQRCWKFTAEHWWNWWENREPDEKTLALRAGIAKMRASFSR